MMRKFSLLPAMALLALFTWNCEKDDICDENTSTTPRLIMQFYDRDNPETKKNVTNLLVAGDGSTQDPMLFTAVSKIELPLNTVADLTAYHFTINSTNTTLDNEDILTFHYTRDDVFVSRACGYKTVFLLDQATPFVQDIGSDGQWMEDITVEQPDIQNENEVHISVYF